MSDEPITASELIAARVAQLRKADPSSFGKADDVFIAKIAESKEPVDRALWKFYREEAQATPIAKIDDQVHVRIAKRLDEMREQHLVPAGSSHDQAILKLASSRRPRDRALWDEYKNTTDAEYHARPQEKSPREIAAERYENADTPPKRALEALIDAHHASNHSGLSRSRVRAHLLNTDPHAQKLLFEHAKIVAGMGGSDEARGTLDT